jgi:hypothetical protein
MLMLLTSSLALIGTGFSILTGNCPFVLQLLWGNLEGPSVPFQSLLLHKEIYLFQVALTNAYCHATQLR